MGKHLIIISLSKHHLLLLIYLLIYFWFFESQFPCVALVVLKLPRQVLRVGSGTGERARWMATALAIRLSFRERKRLGSQDVFIIS